LTDTLLTQNPNYAIPDAKVSTFQMLGRFDGALIDGASKFQNPEHTLFSFSLFPLLLLFLSLPD